MFKMDVIAKVRAHHDTHADRTLGLRSDFTRGYLDGLQAAITLIEENEENTSMKTKIHTATYTDPVTGWEQRVRVTEVFYTSSDPFVADGEEDSVLVAMIRDHIDRSALVSVEHITEVRLEEVEG